MKCTRKDCALFNKQHNLIAVGDDYFCINCRGHWREYCELVFKGEQADELDVLRHLEKFQRGIENESD